MQVVGQAFGSEKKAGYLVIYFQSYVGPVTDDGRTKKFVGFFGVHVEVF